MATINFLVNNNRRILDYSKSQVIYLRYRFGNLDFRKSLNVSVKTNKDSSKSDWNYTTQRVKDRAHIQDRFEINNLLIDLTKHFEELTRLSKQNKYNPQKEDAENHFKDFYNLTDNNENADSFLHFFSMFIAECEKHSTRAKGTLKTYRTALKKVTEYTNTTKKDLKFNDIDRNWVLNFKSWFFSNNELTDNYFDRTLKIIKTILQEAFERDIHSNLEFKKKAFSLNRKSSTTIYLTMQEQDLIYSKELVIGSTKDIVRDSFILMCTLGLRIGDFKKLTKNHIKSIDGVRCVRVESNKTRTEALIELSPRAEEILEKYNGSFPNKLPPQTINNKIKQIAQEVGIDESVVITTTIGGKRVDKTKRKFELITNHTARRSFCTMMVIKGVPLGNAIKMSGHKTEDSFRTYVRMSLEENLTTVNQLNFFENWKRKQ